MALPEGAEINTANSNINYKMKFVFNCKAVTAFGGDGNTYAEQAVPTNPES